MNNSNYGMHPNQNTNNFMIPTTGLHSNVPMYNSNMNMMPMPMPGNANPNMLPMSGNPNMMAMMSHQYSPQELQQMQMFMQMQQQMMMMQQQQFMQKNQTAKVDAFSSLLKDDIPSKHNPSSSSSSAPSTKFNQPANSSKSMPMEDDFDEFSGFQSADTSIDDASVSMSFSSSVPLWSSHHPPHSSNHTTPGNQPSSNSIHSATVRTPSIGTSATTLSSTPSTTHQTPVSTSATTQHLRHVSPSKPAKPADVESKINEAFSMAFATPTKTPSTATSTHPSKQETTEDIDFGIFSGIAPVKLPTVHAVAPPVGHAQVGTGAVMDNSRAKKLRELFASETSESAVPSLGIAVPAPVPVPASSSNNNFIQMNNDHGYNNSLMTNYNIAISPSNVTTAVLGTAYSNTVHGHVIPTVASNHTTTAIDEDEFSDFSTAVSGGGDDDDDFGEFGGFHPANGETFLNSTVNTVVSHPAATSAYVGQSSLQSSSFPSSQSASRVSSQTPSQSSFATSAIMSNTPIDFSSPITKPPSTIPIAPSLFDSSSGIPLDDNDFNFLTTGQSDSGLSIGNSSDDILDFASTQLVLEKDPVSCASTSLTSVFNDLILAERFEEARSCEKHMEAIEKSMKLQAQYEELKKSGDMTFSLNIRTEQMMLESFLQPESVIAKWRSPSLSDHLTVLEIAQAIEQKWGSNVRDSFFKRFSGLIPMSTFAKTSGLTAAISRRNDALKWLSRGVDPNTGDTVVDVKGIGIELNESNRLQCLQVWTRVLTVCYDELKRLSDYVAKVRGIVGLGGDVGTALADDPNSIKFVNAIVEIYYLSHRCFAASERLRVSELQSSISSDINNAYKDLRDINLKITPCWARLLPSITAAGVNVNSSISSLSDSSWWSDPASENPKRCSLCIVPLQSHGPHGETLPGNLTAVAWTQSTYHAACVNFWTNLVSLSPPNCLP